VYYKDSSLSRKLNRIPFRFLRGQGTLEIESILFPISSRINLCSILGMIVGVGAELGESYAMAFAKADLGSGLLGRSFAGSVENQLMFVLDTNNNNLCYFLFGF